MVPYRKDGHEYILIANSSFGVLKLNADKMESYRTIVEPERTTVIGPPFEKIGTLTNVQHLAGIDAGNVLVVSGRANPVNLSTVALP
jgi:hypothetical protein